MFVKKKKDGKIEKRQKKRKTKRKTGQTDETEKRKKKLHPKPTYTKASGVNRSRPKSPR
jgi:hypothetical protein